MTPHLLSTLETEMSHDCFQTLLSIVSLRHYTQEGVELVARLEELTKTDFAASDDVTEVGDFMLETDNVDATCYFVPEKLAKWWGLANT